MSKKDFVVPDDINEMSAEDLQYAWTRGLIPNATEEDEAAYHAALQGKKDYGNMSGDELEREVDERQGRIDKTKLKSKASVIKALKADDAEMAGSED